MRWQELLSPTFHAHHPVHSILTLLMCRSLKEFLSAPPPAFQGTLSEEWNRDTPHGAAPPTAPYPHEPV